MDNIDTLTKEQVIAEYGHYFKAIDDKNISEFFGSTMESSLLGANKMESMVSLLDKESIEIECLIKGLTSSTLKSLTNHQAIKDLKEHQNRFAKVLEKIKEDNRISYLESIVYYLPLNRLHRGDHLYIVSFERDAYSPVIVAICIEDIIINSIDEALMPEYTCFFEGDNIVINHQGLEFGIKDKELSYHDLFVFNNIDDAETFLSEEKEIRIDRLLKR